MSQLIGTLLSENLQVSSREDLLSAIIPLLKLLTLAAIGFGLSYFQTLPRETFKLLSKLVFAVFLPCLIFVNLGLSITLEDFTKWWFIPVNVLISTILGSLLGYLVAVICRPPPELRRFVIIVTGFGNTGNLAIAVVHSVCHNPNNPFGSDCLSKGVAYVSFAQWAAVILVYTFVYHMMEPPLEYYEVVEEEKEEEEKEGEVVHEPELRNNPSAPLLVEAEWLGIKTKGPSDSKTPVIAEVFNPNSESSSQPNTNDSVGFFAVPGVVRKIRVVAERTPINNILQPPTVASLLAIAVGIVPHLKGFVFGHDAPLSFLTDSLDIVAGAMVPAVMLVLGGMLSEGPSDSTLGLRTTVGILAARLVVLPLFGIGIIALCYKLDFVVHGDRMFLFVVLLQYTTPSAILLGAIASLRGYAVREASAILFWQHIFALVSLSVYIVIYFKLLRYV